MKKLTQNEWIEKAKHYHGNVYNYDLVHYINMRSKVKIVCLNHGLFEQNARDHIYKSAGCLKCKYENHYKSAGKGFKSFIEESNIIHNNKYDYSKVVYINNKVKVCIICPEHGEFWQTPNKHLINHGCPICKESKGEKEIRYWLNKYGIKFIAQKKFKDCKNKNVLPFDFYLPDYNTCIEYQGEQHFIPKDCFGGNKSFIRLKENDQIKKNFCKENNINFLEISYIDDLKQKLEKVFGE